VLENVDVLSDDGHGQTVSAFRDKVKFASLGTWDDNPVSIDALGVRISGHLRGEDRLAGEYGEWLLET
jgi:hypothetical protein